MQSESITMTAFSCFCRVRSMAIPFFLAFRIRCSINILQGSVATCLKYEIMEVRWWTFYCEIQETVGLYTGERYEQEYSVFFPFLTNLLLLLQCFFHIQPDQIQLNNTGRETRLMSDSNGTDICGARHVSTTVHSRLSSIVVVSQPAYLCNEKSPSDVTPQSVPRHATENRSRFCRRREVHKWTYCAAVVSYRLLSSSGLPFYAEKLAPRLVNICRLIFSAVRQFQQYVDRF